MPRRSLALALAVLIVPFLIVPSSLLADDTPFVSSIELPPGFSPEGIAAGRGPRLYVGNIRNGSVLVVDPRAGTSSLLVPPADGRFALGLALDARTNHLFVAGGPTGHAFVHDGDTGALIADYRLASGATIVNGVVVTRDAVYFTDSAQPALHKLPLSPGGRLPAENEVELIPLGGDFPVVPRAFNANGVVAAPNGKDLIVVHTAAGQLFRVDPASGITTIIDLDGASVPNGDGLVLRGHTLFVLQNFSNQIAVIDLAQDLSKGTVVDVLTDSRFDVITSGALWKGGLYVTNARFTTRPTPETLYQVVRVNLPRDRCATTRP
jgi:sugar lactone lactonase YvrE